MWHCIYTGLFALRQLPEPEVLRTRLVEIADFVPQKLNRLPLVVNGRLAKAKAARTKNVVDNYYQQNDNTFLAPRPPVHFKYQTTTVPYTKFDPSFVYNQSPVTTQILTPPVVHTTLPPQTTTTPKVHRDVYRAPGP